MLHLATVLKLLGTKLGATAAAATLAVGSVAVVQTSDPDTTETIELVAEAGEGDSDVSGAEDTTDGAEDPLDGGAEDGDASDGGVTDEDLAQLVADEGDAVCEDDGTDDGDADGSVDGDVDADGSVDGDVDADGSVDGDVDADGSVDGDVDADGSVDGDVDADGSVDGDVDADGSVDGDVDADAASASSDDTAGCEDEDPADEDLEEGERGSATSERVHAALTLEGELRPGDEGWGAAVSESARAGGHGKRVSAAARGIELEDDEDTELEPTVADEEPAEVTTQNEARGNSGKGNSGSNPGNGRGKRG